MFVDIAKIYIKSGDGGDGCVSFRREKYVPRGGPDGGDGGQGGDIVFEANPAMRTLLDFRYRRKYEASRGDDGDSGKRTGRSAPPLVIEVPPGTVVRRSDTGEVVADLSTPGERITVLRGGRGGRGNARFTTSTRQKPAFSQPGQRTQCYEVTLELITLADVGLVGYPNAGKSTLLAAATAARPKVGDYPFTTLSPNLGAARFDEYSFVIADIPGLIENAHQGAGLGHDFLRHISRTRMLIHVVDAAGVEGRDPVEDYESIRRELSLFNPALLSLPEIVAANKTDIPGSQENVARLREHVGESARVLPISAATREGVSALMRETVRVLRTLPEPEPLPVETELASLIADRFEVRRVEDGYLVTGTLVDRMLEAANLDNPDSFRQFQRQLRERGIIDALREKGAGEGDTVIMGELQFEFEE
ncbi:MAG: GTPase ObgE [Clostridiales bacterium]|nr:GTPase ObgE [Clostridiales bacterium]